MKHPKHRKRVALGALAFLLGVAPLGAISTAVESDPPLRGDEEVAEEEIPEPPEGVSFDDPPVEVTDAEALPPREEVPCEEMETMDDQAPEVTVERDTVREPGTVVECPVSAPEGTPVPEAETEENTMKATAGLQPIPSWCRERIMKGMYSPITLTRSELCHRTETFFLKVIESPSGTWRGDIAMSVSIYMKTDPKGTTSQLMYEIDQDKTLSWGLGKSPATVLAKGFCIGGATKCSARADKVTYESLDGGSGIVRFVGDVGPGDIVSFAPKLKLNIRIDAPNSSTGGVSFEFETVSCDQALPENQHSKGCVFTRYTPTLEYRLDGPYPELADHIKKAQDSGLPKTLTRLTDQALRDKNRSTACPKHHPRPEGKTCDEYPFASSYEGATTAPTPGVARSFPGCHFYAAEATGPNGWSSCMINGSQNSGGGSWIPSMNRAHRILDGDRYNVAIK